MLKNVLISSVLAFGFALTSVPALSQVYVQIGPPAPVYETVPAMPGRGYVWVPGYYTWTGGRYVWVHGRYVRHAGRWCGGHWRRAPHHGWYWAPGRWC
jgi:hypothetical protein